MEYAVTDLGIFVFVPGGQENGNYLPDGYLCVPAEPELIGHWEKDEDLGYGILGREYSLYQAGSEYFLICRESFSPTQLGCIGSRCGEMILEASRPWVETLW